MLTRIMIYKICVYTFRGKVRKFIHYSVQRLNGPSETLLSRRKAPIILL